MKIKYPILLFPAMVGLSLLQNCGPKGDGCEEHEPVNTYYNISNDDKSKIPFTGYDTLVYISTDGGDTATLYGQGQKTFYERVVKKWNPDPGCSTYDNDYLEQIQYRFIGGNAVLKEVVFMPFIDKDKNHKALVNVNGIYKNDGYGLGYINYDPYYSDSVEINGKTYNGFTIHSGSAKFLYNWRYGFLMLEFEGKTWKLYN